MRAAAWLAIGGQLAFIASWIVAGALEPRYSDVHDYVSELGAKSAAHPWIVNTGIAVLGLSIAVLGPALVPTLRRPLSRMSLAALFVIAGVATGLDSVFRLDCMTSELHPCAVAERAGTLSGAHYTHGQILLVRHRYDEAEEALREALRLDPEDADYYSLLAAIHFVQGKVEDTIPRQVPARIAVLRLDTDWYESTRHEFVHLYPRLSQWGVAIIDDYGHWQGARRATDEFIATLPHPLYLQRIDYTGRLAIKPTP